MQKKGLILGLVLFTSLFVIVFTINGFSSSEGEVSSENIRYTGSVQVIHERDGVILMDERSHNVLFETGQNMTRDALLDGTGVGAMFIALCNATVSNATDGCSLPLASGAEDFQSFRGCGLINASTTKHRLLEPGNWSVFTTFTSTCANAQITNVTRLLNATGGDVLVSGTKIIGTFAGNSFTLVTLQNNDQLTINWTLTAE